MISRRMILTGLGAMAVSSGAIAQSVPQAAEDGELTPPEAFDLAAGGEIVLLDIRRPDEWAATGSAEGAHRLDMRRDDFVATLVALVGGETATPIALICARGHRSRRMTRALTEAGFTTIIDVPEGMLGSRAGPGWIERGLPVNRS